MFSLYLSYILSYTLHYSKCYVYIIYTSRYRLRYCTPVTAVRLGQTSECSESQVLLQIIWK